MDRAWVTTSSNHVAAMVNSLTAACHEGFVPDALYVTENPGVVDEVDRALSLASTVVTAYGGDDPEINVTTLERETEFENIHAHVRGAIESVHDEGGEVAVDITPGRKFMSSIAFATGMRYDADHVYYFHLEDTDFFGQLYPSMPRTAARLYDFVEELRG